MAAKQDIRVERSRESIKRAFLALMKNCAYEEITVKDLAAEAMINRKTFYAHYESKEDLLKSMLVEMFDEICGCLMYPKEEPGMEPDSSRLRADVRRFLIVTTRYSDQLDLLVTDQTASMTFQVTDQVIQERAQMICVFREAAPGRVPMELYVMRLKNFFLSVMDWWLSQQEYTLEEAVEILVKVMRKNISSVFRYERGSLMR